MTNLETNLLEVLICVAVRFCSRAVQLFPACSRKCIEPSYGTFINGFAKKVLTGSYGSYDNKPNDVANETTTDLSEMDNYGCYS